MHGIHAMHVEIQVGGFGLEPVEVCVVVEQHLSERGQAGVVAPAEAARARRRKPAPRRHYFRACMCVSLIDSFYCTE